MVGGHGIEDAAGECFPQAGPIVLRSEGRIDVGVSAVLRREVLLVEEEVVAAVEAAVTFAEESPYPEPTDALKHVFYGAEPAREV